MKKSHKAGGFTRTNSSKSLDGFTIIELIFATLIFSLVMMVILVSVFQVTRIYYKGVSISSTNEAARTTVADIANDVRFGDTPTTIVTTGDTSYFCIGLHRYSFKKFAKVTNDDINRNSPTGIRQDVVSGGCPNPNTPPLSGKDAKQLLGPDMQLNDLKFSCANGACTVGVHIIFYGADNTVFRSDINEKKPTPDTTPAAALRASDASCSGNLQSSQFCAAVDLQTKVLQRL